MRRPPPPPAGSGAPTILALGALLFCGIGLLALTAMVLPQIFWMIAVVCGFVLFGAFQYLLWGRWLSRPDDDADDSRER